MIKSIREDLAVEYATECLGGGGYKHTRTARKAYAYLGLSLDEARDLEAVKVAKYTRPYTSVVVRGDVANEVTIVNLTSEIVIEHEEGEFYRLSVDVHEIDERLSDSSDPKAAFALENMRDYDGDDEPIIAPRIGGGYYNMTTDQANIAVIFTANPKHYTPLTQPLAYIVQKKESPTATSWQTIYADLTPYDDWLVWLPVGTVTRDSLLRVVVGGYESDVFKPEIVS